MFTRHRDTNLALVVALIFAGCAASSSSTSNDTSSSSTATAVTAEPTASTTAEPSASANTSASAGPTETASAEPSGPPPGSAGARLMRQHFAQTTQIQDAVIWGEIEKASRPAGSLADVEGVETLPPKWQESVTQLKDSSRRIRESSDLQEVAAATADIGRACGNCHGKAGGPKIVVNDPPTVDAKSVASRMQRHKWAAARLWEGLYGPSDAAWKAGASALELDPFPEEVLNKGGVHGRSAASNFRDVAKTLSKAKTSDARGSAYASLLSTCAPCHAAVGAQRH
ncbi:MAG: hypothetical protein U0271_06940 [Polyangiaceae bacterium]